MSDNVIQHSFASGELSPSLLARTDLPRYRSGAATMRNFFVDYRSGASSRAGLQFVNQTKFTTRSRLITFQFSADVGFILEFGNFYIRFHTKGATVLNTPINIAGITNANPAVANIPGNTFTVGQWIFITGVNGMPQINNRYYYVSAVAGANVTLQTPSQVNVNSTGYGVYSSGGTAASIYEIVSPYAAADIPLLKFSQLTNEMVITHPSYNPYLLVALGAANWTLTPMNFGTTVGTPTGLSLAASSSGTANYSYIVTAVDVLGQEGLASVPAAIANAVNIQTTAGSIGLIWNAVPNAASYNVYKAEIAIGTPVPAGSAYGFIANLTGTDLIDSNIAPDFSQSPPVAQNPFLGGGIINYTVTAPGSYTTVPTATVPAPPPGGVQATCYAALGVTAAAINAHGTSNIDVQLTTGSPSPVGAALVMGNGVFLNIASATFIATVGSLDQYEITSVTIRSAGSITTASVPTNPVAPSGCTATGFNSFGTPVVNFNLTWGVISVTPIVNGAGYGGTQTVTFTPAGAGAIGNLGSAALGFPSVNCFFQQRLYFAASTGSPTTFWASQPGFYTNFNTSDPIIDSDAITGTLVSAQFNTIKSMLSMPGGLLLLTASGAWQLSSGQGGLASTSAVTPANATATPQAYNGAADPPPIIINYDILYVQSKGSIVRDLSYNIYANIYTGTDISVTSNHLFYGFLVNEWCWTEEPHKIVWIVRNDGTVLSLTYVKEQEMIGWARHDTQGTFVSTASIREGQNDVAYFIVSRYLNGAFVQSVERLVPRYFTYGTEDAWCVDCGISTGTNAVGATCQASSGSGAVTFVSNPPVFNPGDVGGILRMLGGIANITGYTSTSQVNGTWIQPPTAPGPAPYLAPFNGWTFSFPATTFYGLDYLNGQQVSILADGQVVPPQTVTNGSITLPFAASKVVAGLPFTCQLQTMYLDTGDPTIQGKRKILPRVTVRARESQGIKMGRTFGTLLPVKLFNPTPTGVPITITPTPPLVSTDVYYVMDPLWETFGQMCIEVDNPLPVTILGLVPEVVIGDTPSRVPGQAQ